jgi:UDP-N-acetylglucosamine 4,6-dehydratase
MLKGNVLVTGGSGFLGRGLLRRIRRDSWPAEVTVYSRDEEKQQQLRRRYPEVRCILGDVRDLERLTAACTGHDIVIHAAAVKYIPEAEHNVAECIAVNVDGSRNVALAAVRAGVKKVVGLSTDKACLPVNTYGMTKAIMERLFMEANRWSDTRFTTVRYGNVIGSTGSVIPLFRQQLADSGEVQVTDKNMSRFWLSVDQAINLICYALTWGCPATVVYRCPAMRIVELAEVMAVGRPVKIIGIRPGEKMDERLVDYTESLRCVQDGDYYALLPPIAEVNGDSPWTYVSSSPARWIEKDEMAAMIADSEEV